MKRLQRVIFVIIMLGLASACSPTHTTITGAQTGSEGDKVELAAVHIPGTVEYLPESGFTGRDYIRFTACDRDGACMRVDAIEPGRHPEADEFVRVAGGRIEADNGRHFIRANIVSVVPRPADWPE